jgi:hypothetical protein
MPITCDIEIVVKPQQILLKECAHGITGFGSHCHRYKLSMRCGNFGFLIQVSPKTSVELLPLLCVMISI